MARKIAWHRPGHPNWGGSAVLYKKKADPVAKRRGLPTTSAKRRETYGNPFSDHFWLNRRAFAKDYGVANDRRSANAIARGFGVIARNQSVINYRAYYVTWRGFVFRIQIIYSTHGTGPHLHVGVRRERFSRRAYHAWRSRRRKRKAAKRRGRKTKA